MKNEHVQFVWAQFSELNSYYEKQAKDTEKLNGRIAEIMSILTCQNDYVKRKDAKAKPEVKEILSRLDFKVRTIYNELPTNTMMIICTGHGDTAIVRRFVLSTFFLFYSVVEFFLFTPEFHPVCYFHINL